MEYYKDLREFVQRMNERGLLFRYKDPINKNTELVPFVRIQQRGLPDEERKLILFEKPIDSNGRTYDMQVLSGAYSASNRLMTYAMGCESYDEAIERLCYAYDHPIQPVVINDGPVHQEIHTGTELQQSGLEEIPVPVQEVGLSGVIRFGMPFLSKDPQSGVLNFGSYNGFLHARDRIVIGAGRHRVFFNEHWMKIAQKGDTQGLPCAYIIGSNPSIMVASSTDLPYNDPPELNEYSFAGGIEGRPIELVRCKTVPLEVPANAEIVVEGYISTDVVEPRLPFGEYAGYMQSEGGSCMVMNVTAITHRKNAMFTDVLVGLWPSDCDQVSIMIHNALMYQYLKYRLHLPVKKVNFPPATGESQIAVIQVEEGTSQETVDRILQHATDSSLRPARIYIAIDHDLDIHDPENIFWALSFACRPKEDMTFSDRDWNMHHIPTSQPLKPLPGYDQWAIEPRKSEDAQVCSRVLINATRKFPFPPVALPRKEYMERAMELWRAQGLPEPKLKWPWYGYELGYWSEEYKKAAEMMAKGEWLKVGKMMRQHQQRITPERVFGGRRGL